jgi:two-component sensor histidine kinase
MIHSELGLAVLSAGLPRGLAVIPGGGAGTSSVSPMQATERPALEAKIAANVREPLLVLDAGMNIAFSSKSFDATFGVSAKPCQHFFTLDNGSWNISTLRDLLEGEGLRHNGQADCEIAKDFPRIGFRAFTVHVRRLDDGVGTVLLSFEDKTARNAREKENAELLSEAESLVRQTETRLMEVQHRVLNSLQIIASILLMKARAVVSTEAREHLVDAHRRIMAVATVQRHLQNADLSDHIEITPYLQELCAALGGSMIAEGRPVKLLVTGDAGARVAADAVSIGLIVTELMINALKYAFPDPIDGASIIVHFQNSKGVWMLSVSDNGVGANNKAVSEHGLGSKLIMALADQLNAVVIAKGTSEGMRTMVEPV